MQLSKNVCVGCRTEQRFVLQCPMFVHVHIIVACTGTQPIYFRMWSSQCTSYVCAHFAQGVLVCAMHASPASGTTWLLSAFTCTRPSGAEPRRTNCPPRSSVRQAACLIRWMPCKAWS